MDEILSLFESVSEGFPTYLILLSVNQRANLQDAYKDMLLPFPIFLHFVLILAHRILHLPF